MECDDLNKHERYREVNGI